MDTPFAEHANMNRRRIGVDGHFGEWLQGRLGARGPVVLITMPCPKTGVDVVCETARARPESAPDVAQYPAHVARVLLEALQLRAPERFRIIPRCAAGLGTGVSTAGLVGLARIAGWRGQPEGLAHACIAAEGASDPLMFPQPDRVLWGSRSGTIHGWLQALPRHEVIGGFWGGPQPTDATDHDFPDISDLVSDWQSARRLSDFARLASESGRRCLAHRGPQDDPTDRLAADLGALGWNMAHTGAARGFVFQQGAIPPDAPEILRKAGYEGIVQFTGGRP